MSWRRLVCVFAVVPLLSGCAGADGQEAMALLQQASTAQQNVKSMTFSANVKVAADGQELGFRLKGGGYARGAHRGDFFLDMEMTGSLASLGATAAGLPSGRIRVAAVGGRAWMEFGGRKTVLPASLSAGRSVPRGSSAFAGFDFTRYVTQVRVEGGHVLNGRTMTKIVGVLDTASLLEGLASLGGTFGQTGAPIPDFDGHVGDTRVVIFVDDVTHLLTAALADVEATGGGQNVKLHLDFAITSVDKPVALPRG
jgi:hypothetical protein